MDGRKPRADAKLRNMPPNQRTALADWLVDGGLSYAEAKVKLASVYRVKTSIGAIANFYATECWNLRFRQAKGEADRVKELIAEEHPDFDKATLAALSQRVFDMSIAKDGSPKDILTLATVIGDSRRLEIEEKKLKLRREKNKQSASRLQLESKKIELMEIKAAKEMLARSTEVTAIASDAGLSSKEKVDRVRRLVFGAAHVKAADGKEARS